MKRQVGNTRIEMVRGDITKDDSDAIVNAANSSLMGGGGVDGAIHRAGGPAILDECRKIVARQGRLPAGEAVLTTGGRLAAGHVIHTVGPVYSGSARDAETLADCHIRSLQLAVVNGLASVAFPAISTGAYGYPVERAAPVAVGAVADFVRKNSTVKRVRFVLFSAEALAAYEQALAALPADDGARLQVRARPGWVEISAPSRRDYLARLNRLFEELAARRLTPETIEELKIALDELLTNAMEWGNREDPDKPVQVSYCLFPDELVLKIQDLGDGFDPGAVPDPLNDPLAAAQAREKQGKRPGGFGMLIARKVMDSVIYNQPGNCVVMSKRLSQPKPKRRMSSRRRSGLRPPSG